ncbi:response regulator [Granulicella paludicola]|jgi:CheY-like chemotaxis protein|uniref:response regulator n=1 Tax=Granulicella paludicola TaxID=474951 RepID=UPI0021DFF5AB|nr:response regulator [Granulicella paludicola]
MVPNTISKLLVVDDEPQIRTVMEQVFTQLGYSVRTASDGFSALRQLREWMPNVIVSDLNMPGMSGFELLSVIRRRLASIYVVASSGAYTSNELPPGVAADAFHPKGTSMHSLVKQVEVWIDEDLRASRKQNGAPPIWTSRCRKTPAGERPSGALYAMISCPECLRALPQLLREDERTMHKTECTHCQTPIEYAIVQELDPATSQPYATA